MSDVRFYHLGLDIRGAIQNGEFRHGLLGMFRDAETLEPLTADEILAMLLDHVAAGHRLLPCCSAEECPDFSFQTGCPGHPEKNPPELPTLEGETA